MCSRFVLDVFLTNLGLDSVSLLADKEFQWSLAQFPGCTFSVPVSPGSETVQSLGAKFSIGFKLDLVGRCSTVWSKSLSPRVPGAPHTPKVEKQSAYAGRVSGV